MAFNSVAVSIVFVAMRCGSCDRKTWETKRMAISISLDVSRRTPLTDVRLILFNHLIGERQQQSAERVSLHDDLDPEQATE